ncbi:TPA: hypothetical protein QC181_006391 [Bacillus cereus]|nr:hypothetical protein [Bacillus cereus]
MTVKALGLKPHPITYLSSEIPPERRESYDEMNKLFVKYAILALSGKL